MSEVMEKWDETEALALVRELQGDDTYTVPVYIKGKLVHPGLKFTVQTAAYNQVQSKIAAQQDKLFTHAEQFLRQNVAPEHKNFLIELLKVKGGVDQVFTPLFTQMTSAFNEQLD